MQSKVIIFDLDGVLFDTVEHIIQFFLDAFPTMTRDMVYEMWADNINGGFESIKKQHSVKEETEEEKVARNRFFSEKKATMPVHAGMKELIDRLHAKGYVLVVNTAALEKNCLPLLKKSDLLGRFDSVAARGEGVLTPSKVEKFKMIAGKYKVETKDMIFITDTLGDIIDAELAGVPTIAVTWGAHDRKYFTRRHFSNLIAIIDSTEELADKLNI